MSKSHAQQWTIVEAIDRPAAASIAALAAFSSTQIADCGGPVGIVGPGLGQMAGGPEFCGPAVTLWTKPGDILFVLKLPDLVQAGDVVAVDGDGRADAAIVGDIVAGEVASRGAAGIVVDGAIRDIDGMEELGLPIFARNTCPATGSNEGPGAINVPIQLGGVAVNPGDVIRGDSSGLVVVPAEHLDCVIELTRAVADREIAWRQAIADGSSLAGATGVDALIAAGRTAKEVALP